MLFKSKAKSSAPVAPPPVVPEPPVAQSPVVASTAPVADATVTATLQDLKSEYPDLYAQAVAEGAAQYKVTEARASSIRSVCEKAGVDNADELIAGNDSPEKIAYDLLMSAKPAAKPKTEFNKPVTQQAQDNDVEHKTFADACASYRKTNNSTYREAQKACSTMYPELFEKSTHNSVDKER